jgi:hypothetical protein
VRFGPASTSRHCTRKNGERRIRKPGIHMNLVWTVHFEHFSLNRVIPAGKTGAVLGQKGTSHKNRERPTLKSRRHQYEQSLAIRGKNVHVHGIDGGFSPAQ